MSEHSPLYEDRSPSYDPDVPRSKAVQMTAAQLKIPPLQPSKPAVTSSKPAAVAPLPHPPPPPPPPKKDNNKPRHVRVVERYRPRYQSRSRERRSRSRSRNRSRSRSRGHSRSRSRSRSPSHQRRRRHSRSRSRSRDRPLTTNKPTPVPRPPENGLIKGGISLTSTDQVRSVHPSLSPEFRALNTIKDRPIVVYGPCLFKTAVATCSKLQSGIDVSRDEHSDLWQALRIAELKTRVVVAWPHYVDKDWGPLHDIASTWTGPSFLERAYVSAVDTVTKTLNSNAISVVIPLRPYADVRDMLTAHSHTGKLVHESEFTTALSSRYPFDANNALGLASILTSLDGNPVLACGLDVKTYFSLESPLGKFISASCLQKTIRCWNARRANPNASDEVYKHMDSVILRQLGCTTVFTNSAMVSGAWDVMHIYEGTHEQRVAAVKHSDAEVVKKGVVKAFKKQDTPDGSARAILGPGWWRENLFASNTVNFAEMLYAEPPTCLLPLNS